MGWVYLIHFERPYHHAKHYLGFTSYGSVSIRFAAHQNGQGANLTQHVVRAGIALRLVRVWKGDRRLERKLKRISHIPERCCPICNPRLADYLAGPVTGRKSRKGRAG
jgi:hypothetical protein